MAVPKLPAPRSAPRPLVRPAKLAMNPTIGMTGPLPGSTGPSTISKTGTFTPQAPAAAKPPVVNNVPPGGLPSTPAAPAAPAAPDMSGDNWKAYLTPDQLGALNTLGNNTQAGIAADQRKISDAQDQYNTNDAQAQYQHDNNVSSANNEMAGRGLFLSSIRDNDLTDIDRTLVNYRATATANLNSLTNDANAAIANLGANWNTAVLAAMGDAAAQAPVPTAAPAAAVPPLPPARGLAGLPTAPGIVSRSTPINTAPSAANRAPIAKPPSGPFGKPPESAAKPGLTMNKGGGATTKAPPGMRF